MICAPFFSNWNMVNLLDLSFLKRFLNSVCEPKPRLQFYVYCKTCQDVQPGKLRVCCAECKQGTLVLTEVCNIQLDFQSFSILKPFWLTALIFVQEPSEWYDIQGSGRLTGRCHIEGCNGKTAVCYWSFCLLYYWHCIVKSVWTCQVWSLNKNLGFASTTLDPVNIE